MKSYDFKLLPGSMFLADEGAEPAEFFQESFRRYRFRCRVAYGVFVVWLAAVATMVSVGVPLNFIALSACLGIALPYRMRVPEYSHLRRNEELPPFEVDCRGERPLDNRLFSYLTGVAYARFGLLNLTVCWISALMSVVMAPPEMLSSWKGVLGLFAFTSLGWLAHDYMVQFRPVQYGLRHPRGPEEP